MMKMKTLAALTLLVSPLFTVQMVQAQENVHSPVQLAELAKSPVKTIVPITAKLKNKQLLKLK